MLQDCQLVTFLRDLVALFAFSWKRGVSFQVNLLECHAIVSPQWPQVHEKGGGAVIPCDYFIKCSPCMVQFVKDTLQSAVNQMKEKDAMSIQ